MKTKNFKIKKDYIIYLLLIVACSVKAQEFSSYETPLKTSWYSNALKDSIGIEVTLPKELKLNTGAEYPVIYLLDKQLENNYKYNLNTIDYLSTLQWMPKAIIVGIAFPHARRTAWTVPNAAGGSADNLIAFIEKELYVELKQKYPASNFNLLIGHSRTAIFSSYALSKKSDFFNGIIASSVSNFDFGDNEQQKQFEFFLNEIGSVSHKYFYYFSVGEKSYGDLHESAVDALVAYLKARDLPENLVWNYDKHQIAHRLTPGLTVSKALSSIFKEYGRRLDLCFEMAKQSKNKVPWDDFMNLYAKMSSQLGFKIQPSELFYNSIASEYYNDYDKIYGDNNLHFALEVLLKAIERYPQDFNYYSWIGELYITLKEFDKGVRYLNKAEELLHSNQFISEKDRSNYLKDIQAIKTTK